MMIRRKDIDDYVNALKEEEKSTNTILKYIRDLKIFLNFLNEREIDKKIIVEYKEWLIDNYKPSSANSMIAALNHFLHFMGKDEMTIKQLKIQRSVYIAEERELTKEEYFKLVEAAYKKDRMMGLVMETIGSTGIRVSELQYLTVEALASAEFLVSLKGKMRKIMLTKALCQKLRRYCHDKNIEHGRIFQISRTAIWKRMKLLSAKAGICKEKVFPHNLRHMFAKCFYEIEKDIVKLADILGHSNINTTHIYLLSTGKEHRRMLERMELVLGVT